MSVGHGFAFKGVHFREQGDFIVLTPGNFREEGGFKDKDGNEKYYDGPIDPRFLLTESQVVVAMTEQSRGLLGSTATIPCDNVYLHNQRIGLIHIEDPSKLDLRFVYHLLNTPLVRQHIQATATGSKVRHTAPERLEALEVVIPEIEYQHKVGRALDGLELLVKNNQRRIEILENTERLLYRAWFVHYRFPGHEEVELVDSAIGPIPEGWQVGEFADLVSETSRTVPPADVPNGAPVVGLGHLPRRSTTLQHWDSAFGVGSRRKIFEEGDILFAKIRPYFHKVVDAPFTGFASTDAIVFQPKSQNLRARALAVASSDEFVGVATATSNGTRMPRANTEILLSYRVPHPTPSVEQAFNELARPMNLLRKILVEQSRCLSSVRDLLLPRLVSGELDISDLDLELEAVGV